MSNGYTADEDDRCESAMARLHDDEPLCEAPWCRRSTGATHFATFTTGVQRRVCEYCVRELPRISPGVILEPITYGTVRS